MAKYDKTDVMANVFADPQLILNRGKQLVMWKSDFDNDFRGSENLDFRYMSIFVDLFYSYK